MLKPLVDYIISDKQFLTFSEDLDTPIPVMEESREVVCIGSTNKSRIKVQITTKQGCDKYEIRCEPQIVSLKKGEACEFEEIGRAHV